MPTISGNVGAVFNGGTITRTLNVAESSDTASDLLVITEPAGYANNSPTGNVLRATDGTTNVFLVDAYGDATVRSPAGQGNPQLRLLSTDNASFDITLSNNGVNVVDASGALLFQAISNSFRTASTALGFYGHAVAAQPVVPLTVPTVQNVIDALVAVGLVVQHD